MTTFSDIIKFYIENGAKNFVFIGEAGSGKSEVSINFSSYLAKTFGKPVHFFDMDMTKPLFRSRDVEDALKQHGVSVHYQEQFMDAPTIVGGVRRALRNEHHLTVLDVGGDHIGARSIGVFEELISSDNTVVFYVLNSFRPWSGGFEDINETFAKIMAVTHLDPDKIQIISNPNIGAGTEISHYRAGIVKTKEMISPHKEPVFSCASRSVYGQMEQDERSLVFPIDLYIDIELVM